MARGMLTVSERIVERIADTTGSDVSELPTLYDAVDPEALDTLVERMSSGVVSFTYADHRVTVNSDGSIHLEERPSGSHAAPTARSDS